MHHIIQLGDTLYKIAKKYDLSLNKLLAANPQLKADPNTIAVGDPVQISPSESVEESTTKGSTKPTANKSTGRKNYFEVAVGQLTFDAEGMETPGKYFSRKPHVPGAWSGVTVGRGYDLSQRSEDEIITDLTHATVPLAKAKKLARARGLRGRKATKFLQDNGLSDITITAKQQQQLFLLTYEELAGDVQRICRKADVVAKYGETDWQNLAPKIRDIAVDLRYRGDYTGATRERVQPILVSNDEGAMAALMADKDYWVGGRGVPLDRFRRRRDYLA